ncbi:MAG: hypothetical protein ACT4QD_25995, partial [Acidobacteriota bacterium]
MRISSVALLLALTTAILAAQSQEPTPRAPNVSKGQPGRSGPADQQRNAPAGNTTPPITVVVQPPPEDPAATTRQEQRDERNVRAQERVANLTAWLAGLGLATLFFIGWQAWETRKSANAALRASLAAEHTVTATVRAFLLHERWECGAYKDVGGPKDVGGKRLGYGIVGVLKNSGRVPALDVSMTLATIGVGAGLSGNHP